MSPRKNRTSFGSGPASRMRQMSRRKSEVRFKPIETYAGTDPPQWTDILRGCMIAIVEKQHPLWDARFRSAKERILDIFADVAAVLQNQDARMNEWAVLEKWCWMMEMYARAVEFSLNWRYTNSMNFISNFTGNGNVYIGCLSKERLVELTARYGTAEEQPTAGLILNKKNSRFSKGTAMFQAEMEHYASIIKETPLPPAMPPTMVPIVVSTPSNPSSPLQIVTSPTEAAKQSAATPSKRTRQKVARATAIVTTATLADVLAAQQHAMVTTMANTSNGTNGVGGGIGVVPKQELPDFSADKSAFSRVKAESGEENQSDWSRELTFAFVEAIKERPQLWTMGNGNFKLNAERKRLLAEVVAILENLSGTRYSDNELTAKWSLMKETFMKFNKKLKAGVKSGPEWEFFSRMQFLAPQEENAEPEPSTSTTGLINNGADLEVLPAHLQKLLQDYYTEMNNGPAAKRHRVSSPSHQQQKKAEPPHVVSTWVPPKEDAVISAYFPATVATTAAPTATAQVMATAGAPLTALFLETPKENRKQVNGIGKRNAAVVNHETPSAVAKTEETKQDRWTHLGRLVEQTCRDLEMKNEELSVILQKELVELLCKYQLKSLSK